MDGLVLPEHHKDFFTCQLVSFGKPGSSMNIIYFSGTKLTIMAAQIAGVSVGFGTRHEKDILFVQETNLLTVKQSILHSKTASNLERSMYLENIVRRS